CAVTATTPSASGSVVIGTGMSVCQPTTGGGVFEFLVTSAETVDVFTGHEMQFQTNPRIDIVGIDQTTGGAGVLYGTPNALPDPPSVPSTFVPLAQLQHAAGATTIPSSAIIADLRSFVGLNPPTVNRAKLISTADQTLNDTTVTVVSLSSASYDVGGMADLANNRVKVTKAGWYVFSARVSFAFNATGY